jgi:hypothetical protein
MATQKQKQGLVNAAMFTTDVEQLDEALRPSGLDPVGGDRRRFRTAHQPGRSVAADDRRVLLRDQLDCRCSRVLDARKLGSRPQPARDGSQESRPVTEQALVFPLSRLRSLGPPL